MHYDAVLQVFQQSFSAIEELDPGVLQRPEAFHIPLLKRERKMAAAWRDSQPITQKRRKSALSENQATGDLLRVDLDHTTTPPKQRMGVDSGHPLEPIAVKKIHSNTAQKGEQSQARPTLFSSQLLAASEADSVSSGRSQAAKPNGYEAGYEARSIDSMGDSIIEFCDRLFRRAKAGEAKRKVTEMSDILFHECPDRRPPPSSTDAPEPCAPQCNPERAPYIPPKPRSRLPYLKMTRTIAAPQRPTLTPELLPSDKLNIHPCWHKTQVAAETGHHGQKRTQSRQKGDEKSTKNMHASPNSVCKTPPSCEPKDAPSRPCNLLPLRNVCRPPTRCPDKAPQCRPEPSRQEQEEYRPLSKPQLALDHTFQLLRSDIWEQKLEGLRCICRLAQWHSDVLMARLHDVCLAVIQEVQNLRSQVSRAAVATLGHLYLHLKQQMDSKVDWTGQALLQKSGETNVFLQKEVDMALSYMVQSCTPSRSMKALLSGSLRHHNATVRHCAARHLLALVQNMGTAHLICRQKDILDNLLSAASRLPLDASPLVRFCGRQILEVLMTDQVLQKRMKFLS
ncbi:hypothetical protein GJAV_G00268150 [Gymnothorax javanicus]|nr:hypothetical protein GJAV_G00268150 [Gymnothorax javanicus]